MPDISQKQVMHSWESMETRVVSVICTTYNHELYIEQALDGILAQETKYPFELIIHDDASTDNTASIIRKYQSRYPNIIRAILQEENQYTKNVLNPFFCTMRHSIGKYIAFCEGDDYWIDPHKLQKQVDKMELHSELDFSFHPAYCLRNGVLKKNPSWSYGKEKKLYPDSILSVVGQFAPTASYMFRREAIARLPVWFYKTAPVGDFFLEMYGAKRGGGLYIDSPMSVYRTNAIGSWSVSMEYNSTAILQHSLKYLESLQLLENDFRGNTEAFGKKRSALLFAIAIYYLARKNYALFRQYLNESANQYSFFSKKQELSYKLQYVPWVLRLGYKYKSLVPFNMRRRIDNVVDGAPNS